MLHEINESVPTARQAMDAEYRRLVTESGSEGISSMKALDIAAGIVDHLIDLGEVESPDRHMALVSEGKSVDKAHGGRADSIIAKMARGQFHLFEDDELLDTVVTLGDGKRKAWRHVATKDLQEMHDIRHRNMKAAVDSFKSFEADYFAVRGIVFQYLTVGAAAAAGAFTKAETA